MCPMKTLSVLRLAVLRNTGRTRGYGGLAAMPGPWHYPKRMLPMSMPVEELVLMDGQPGKTVGDIIPEIVTF